MEMCPSPQKKGRAFFRVVDWGYPTPGRRKALPQPALNDAVLGSGRRIGPSFNPKGRSNVHIRLHRYSVGLGFCFLTRTAYTFTASPRQLGCPQVHTTSGFPSVASQCGLQYFDSLLAAQLHAGFAQFLSAIRSSIFGPGLDALLKSGPERSIRGPIPQPCDYDAFLS